jgi:two-component system KDP operon response regulator KdpE
MTALVVEDDRDIRRSVRTSLEASGWTVNEAETLRQALALIRSRGFDLAIVDLGLPDGDGVDLIASIRADSQVPIIVLSARSEEQNKVLALDAGADDYVEKPFRAAEFLARVRAHMRRQRDDKDEQQTFALVGRVEFDRAARVVRKHGKDVRLTKTEYALLDFLVRNAGRVLTHRQLLREVWGPGRVEHTPYLRVFMASLRQKLEDDTTQPKLIITETGVGYRLMAGEPGGSESG